MCTNSNIFPLMLLVCSVNTPIHINRPHLLTSRCASRVLCGLDLKIDTGNAFSRLADPFDVGTDALFNWVKCNLHYERDFLTADCGREEVLTRHV